MLGSTGKFATPDTLTSDQTGRNPICPAAQTRLDALADAKAMRHTIVGIDLDAAAAHRAEAHPESFSVALDCGSAGRERGPVNSLWFIRDGVADETNHRRETFGYERAVWMEPDHLPRGFVRQIEPA